MFPAGGVGATAFFLSRIAIYVDESRKKGTIHDYGHVIQRCIPKKLCV